jgi:2'-5' RNA ligase
MSRFGYAIISQQEIFQVRDLTKLPARAYSKPPALSKNADSVRVFFALWPEPAIQRKLHTIAKQHQLKCDARVMRTETLHMTLQFIGNIKHTQLPELIKAADNVSCALPFALELDTLSFWKHNRIGYATCATHIPALDKLVAALQQVLTKANVTFDNTKFSPHVTLLRNVEHILAAQNFTPVAWQVNSFVLVESVTTNQRTQYRILREWPFASLKPSKCNKIKRQKVI